MGGPMRSPFVTDSQKAIGISITAQTGYLIVLARIDSNLRIVSGSNYRKNFLS
ncbi:hypothetical protein [Microcoleus sp. CAWBG640]|uniref:hypothetical protein n=1 Tax=Microcoleus sp. CAWBG640 TaxID=2841653 RepID=UPI00312BA3AC